MNVFINNNEFFTDNLTEKLKNKLSDITIKEISIKSDLVNFCTNSEVDLIVFDLNSTDDIQILKALQKKLFSKKIFIILMTNIPYEKLDLDNSSEVIFDYLLKPVNINLLIDKINAYYLINKERELLINENQYLKDELIDEEKKCDFQERLILHQSRTSIMGEMIGAIAHQWRQPLNVIATSIINLETKAILGTLNLNEIKRISLRINSTLQNLSRTIDEFRNFFLTSQKKESIDLVNVIRDTISLINTQFKAHGIVVNFEYDENNSYKIDGYFNELRQVVLNILANSKDAFEILMKEHKAVDGEINIKLIDEEDCIKITLSDNAGGIPENIISKIFNPYFSTKSAEQGTGIGLYLTKSIVEKFHDAKINVYNSELGACFVIKFIKKASDK